MATILIPRTHLRQPQERVAVNSDVWPGRSQVFLPSLRHSGVIGGVETLSLPSANQPFSRVGPLGIEHAWRPNTSTLPGESQGWAAGNFDVGQDASMIFVGARIDSLWAGITYGGPSWGLWLGFDGSTVRAAYVDNPTTASYTATITSSGAGNGELFAVGLVKRGNTVKAITSRAVAATTGGNGGIRGSAGSGLYGQAAVVDGRIVYASTVLSAISSTPLADAHMQDLLDNPWRIFRADPLRIYSLPSGPVSPTITGITASLVTSSSARITLGLTR